MDYEKNIKYFNSSDKLFYIGLPILAVGAIFIICELFWFYFIPAQMLIGAVLAALGAALAFIPRSMRSNEKDIDAIVSSMTENYAKEVTENLGLETQIIRNIPPAVIGNYIYDDKNLLMRRGKDDRKYRTSKYSTAAILCTKNGMVISHKTFSLIDETVTEKLYEFPFSEIDGVSVKDGEKKLEDGTMLKDSRFIIAEDGKEVLNLPTLHTVAVDRLCESIRCMIGQTKK